MLFLLVLTPERLEQFIEEFKKRLHAECFIYGNYNREKALSLTDLSKYNVEFFVDFNN